MLRLLFFLTITLLPRQAFSQHNLPALPDSIRWLQAMTAEVASVGNAQENIQQWMNELDAICKKDDKDYAAQRPQAMSLCRRIIRLGLRENAGYPVPKYLQLLKQLSYHFHGSNDTLTTMALEMEYNRLYYHTHMSYELMGEIASEETNLLGNMFGSGSQKTRIRLLWLSYYLFGRHGLASRTEVELSINYMENAFDFTAGLFYWERAKMDLNSKINDADTNGSYIIMRDSVVTPFLNRLGAHDKDYQQQLEYRELLFHSDLSPSARQARQEILPMVERTNHGDIVSALLYRELGIDHLSRSDLNYAVLYFQKSINDYQHCAGNFNDTLLWSNTLYLLGRAQERSGNNKEAKKAYEQAAKLLKGSPSIEYTRFFSLISQARLCINQGERFSTRKVMKEIEAILNGLDDTDFHFDFLPDIGAEYKNKNQAMAMLYSTYLQVRAMELESSSIDEAIDYAYFDKQFLEKVNMTDNYHYYQTQLLLARLQLTENGLSSSLKGKVPNPKALIHSCIEAYRQGKTIEPSDVASAYNLLAEMEIREGKEAEAANNYRQAYQAITDYALQHLFTMTEGNRAKFWEKVKPALTQTLKGCIDHAGTMPTLTEVALDCSLFMKGLLLQSANELRHIVYESGDRALISQYEQLLQKQETEQLSDHLSTQPEELELLHHSTVAAELAEVKASFLFNSEQLKKTLKKGEIAIELVETDQLFDDRSIITTDHQYGAIVVSANKDLRYIPLFRGKDMERITRLTDPRLYKQIWQPLESIISDCRTIYFSASGLLHSLPIENAITNDGKAISERFSIHRLSSLRQLSLSTKKAKEKAAIFGGLSQQDWQAQSAGNDDGLVFRDLPDLESLRGARVSLKELPGTLEEATYLDDLLHKKHIPTTFQQKSHGTEGTFKKLSGQGVTLLHIGTHGYASSVEDGVTDENVLLSRCGLLLAGAGNTLSRSGFPIDSFEDGILTAREICSMDLRGLDMAVLSACKTGLGEISSDGVFGLQRGFKKAGAKTLVMSLRNVDDQITTRFIRFFYENIYQKGMTKHDAFVSAQKQLRHELPEHSDEWTTFIMIDD